MINDLEKRIDEEEEIMAALEDTQRSASELVAEDIEYEEGIMKEVESQEWFDVHYSKEGIDRFYGEMRDKVTSREGSNCWAAARNGLDAFLDGCMIARCHEERAMFVKDCTPFIKEVKKMVVDKSSFEDNEDILFEEVVQKLLPLVQRIIKEIENE